MKRPVLLISIILILISSLHAQEIPNAGFENWTGNEPNEWLTNNPIGGTAVVTPTLSSRNGNFSARLRVEENGGFPYPAIIIAGTNGMGFPITQAYEALNGYFQFYPQPGDIYNVIVQIWEGGIQGTLLGIGGFSTITETASWTQFSVPIDYSQSGTPDWCSVSIALYAETNTLGTALVDDLSFGSANVVEQISGLLQDYKLKQNYPNPFNPTTNIEYSIPEASFVQLKVYDVLGNEVATLVNEEQSPGVYRADFVGTDLTSGIYFYTLQAESYIETKKMILLK